MLWESQREKHLAETQRAALEVVRFEDLGTDVLPRLERALGASGGCVHRYDTERRLGIIAADQLDMIAGYQRDYFAGDPMQRAQEHVDQKLIIHSRLPEWK